MQSRKINSESSMTSFNIKMFLVETICLQSCWTSNFLSSCDSYSQPNTPSYCRWL